MMVTNDRSKLCFAYNLMINVKVKGKIHLYLFKKFTSPVYSHIGTHKLTTFNRNNSASVK